MAGNKYVGRTTAASAGLVLQSKTEIDTNEFGLMQGTLKFYLLNEKWPDLEPSRGTALTGFTAGDSRTQAVFDAYGTYIGKQTSRFIRNGCAPGVGTLEVLCQGAKFTQNPTSSITSIPVTIKGAGYSAIPTITLLITQGTEQNPAFMNVAMEMSGYSVFAGGTGYVAGDTVTASGGAWGQPIILRVVTAGTGGSIKASDGAVLSVSNRGFYSSLPSNHVATTTSGSGTGATIDFTWRVAQIVINYGGLYAGVDTGDITATLSGATGTINAALGTVRMGTAYPGEAIEITDPWKPRSTTKDTVQFFISASADANGTQVKFATTTDLGPANLKSVSGPILLKANTFGSYRLIVDGSPVSAGDIILVKDESRAYRNGVYVVSNPGFDDPNTTAGWWVLERVAPFDAAAAFTTALNVFVQSGTTNANTTWHCDVNVTTLATYDTEYGGGGDSITFSTSASATAPTITDRVTIDYHTIDLHFEYMASRRLEKPLFIQTDYSMDDAGFIATDSSTTPDERQLLQIDSATSESVTTDPTTGLTTYSPLSVPIARSVWQKYVKFYGTGARFEQTPAGQFYHILETASIKIVPLASTPL